MLLISCGGNPIEGVWKVDNLDPEAAIVYLRDNGELVTTHFFGDEVDLAGNYTTDSESNIILNNETYGEASYFYKISGTTLSLIENDETVFEFTKSVERDGFIRKFIGSLLGITVKYINDYAIAIIVFTILLKVILLPISINQTKSTVKMNKVAPIVAKINEKYKHDKQKAQQKTMELYQKAKINPLAGCLPLIINMVLLIAFFRVLLYPDVFIYSDGQSIINANAGLLKGSFLWIENLSKPDLLANISFFGKIIPESAKNIVPGIMPILTAAVTVFSFNSMATPQQPGQNNAMMTSMKYMMPLMFLFLGAKYPASLMVYWTVSSVFQMIQQPIIKKLVDKEVA
ncbi:MAG: membrane protein insertase YidC [Clostridia bacterium]|nr:membrane protein insertase YidC [Clostridia bacterium]